MITAKTLAETKPMNNTKKERISNDKKPNRICFFDLLRFIIITAFLGLLYHKIAGERKGYNKNAFRPKGRKATLLIHSSLLPITFQKIRTRRFSEK